MPLLQSHCDYRKNATMARKKTPAEVVIEKCGGVSVVAKLAGVHVSNVHRWTYPKAKGGTGGTVPSKKQRAILDGARKRGIKLTPDDFFAEVAA